MRKIKKFTALIMCLIMLISTCPALFMSAYAVTAPAFTFTETSKSGSTVTYELKLKSGSFNAIDFNFVTTGAVCTSIVLPPELGAVANVNLGTVSGANLTTFGTAGATVATITFTTLSSSHSVDVKITNCSVTVGTDNVDVTKDVVVSYDESKPVDVGNIFKSIINFFSKIFQFIVKAFQFIINLLSGGTTAAAAPKA